MALELEQTIMTEIGLHSNYRWFNGSGSCAHIRRQAAERLREAIQRHHDAAEEIVPPDERLIEEVKRIARSVDESEYSLTKTWEACSYIVAAHIHAFHGQPEKVLADMANFLAEEYQPRFAGASRRTGW